MQPGLVTVSQLELGKDSESSTHTRAVAPAFHSGGKEEWKNMNQPGTKCFITMSASCFLCDKGWSPLPVKLLKIAYLPSACLQELESNMQILYHFVL